MQVQTADSTKAQDICVFMRTRGFSVCGSAAEVEALHALATRLIPGPIASIETLARAQALTGHSLFLFGGKASPTAFVAAFTFTDSGERAIRTGRFNARLIQSDWIAPLSASTRAAYLWGLGGSDRAGAFAAMRALRIMRERFFASVDLYARASTPAGRRLMSGFGLQPFAGGDPDVLAAPALSRRDAPVQTALAS